MTDMPSYLRLGVNIDHVATLRNARAEDHPDPVRAALIAQEAGADGITVHLREDRRHIKDHDAYRLQREISLPLNLEMAATKEMLAIALDIKPHACCLVPERREELTTEGGLDVVAQQEALLPFIERLKAAGIRVSLFVDATSKQLQAAAALKADIVELHTGRYCHASTGQEQARELALLEQGAALAGELGLECHAGHGLRYDNVEPVAAIPTLVELNIGHYLMGEALYVGLHAAITRMREHMDRGRGY